MVASIGRYLHTPIDAVEEFEVDRFFAYFATIETLLTREAPPSR